MELRERGISGVQECSAFAPYDWLAFHGLRFDEFAF